LAIATYILLGLGTLMWLIVTGFAKAMWTGDGLGQSIAKSLSIGATVVLWSAMAAAATIAMIRVPRAALDVVQWAGSLALGFGAAWLTIRTAGRVGVRKWVRWGVVVPPMILLAALFVDATASWREAMPEVLLRLAPALAIVTSLLAFPALRCRLDDRRAASARRAAPR